MTQSWILLWRQSQHKIILRTSIKNQMFDKDKDIDKTTIYLKNMISVLLNTETLDNIRLCDNI